MPTYKDLGNGNFEKTVPSTEQLNVDALLAQIAEHQTFIDVRVTDLQAAADAGTVGASDAITTLTAQPLSSTLAKAQPLSAVLATPAQSAPMMKATPVQVAPAA